jgi:predicted regulator of Ras-like GTPase activity (Roadblock/LC7/MglB family)
MLLDHALLGLRDVDDVHGSFLLDRVGTLLARDLPAVFRDELLADVGPRLARLRQTLESNGEDVKSLVLRFTEHKLHLRPVGKSLLCVITGSEVNAPALRMATNLVAKHVEMEAETPAPPRAARAASGPAPRVATPPPPAVSGPPAPMEPVPVAKREVMYRGRRPG